MTERVVRCGTFLRLRHEKGQHYFVLEDRDGGMFSITFEEWDLLVEGQKLLPRPKGIPKMDLQRVVEESR